MRHVIDHIIHHGCIRRGSAEENEEAHNQFKELYNHTNKHVDSIAPQLLCSWVDNSVPFDDVDSKIPKSNESSESEEQITHVDLSVWKATLAEAQNVVGGLSGLHPPSDVVKAIIHINTGGVPIWRPLKRVKLPRSARNFDKLTYKNIFCGDIVYGKHNRRDGILFNYCGREQMGLLDTVVAHSRCADVPHESRAVLVRLLETVALDEGNTKAVQVYGHIRVMCSRSTTGFVETVLVDAADIIEPLMVVIDTYWVKQNFGVHKKIDDLPTDPQTQASMRYFVLHKFNFQTRSQFSA